MVEENAILKVKLCLVGDSCVGKTSLIRRYVWDEFDDHYLPTLGAKISKKNIALQTGTGSYLVKMTVWDIMGEKKLTDLLKDSYFDGAGGILAVCDLTREETLEGLDEWIMASRSIAGEVPITIVGNKLDLRDEIAMDSGKIAEYAGGYNSPYFLTSAKTGENVDSVFLNLAKRVLARTHVDI